MAYDRDTPRQLCQFHLLSERKRNIGGVGFSDSKAPLGSDDMEQARDYTRRIVALTGGNALYWPDKALDKGLTHLRPGENRATSLLERFNREIRARERMGSVWIVHNLLVPLQMLGVLP